MFAKHQRNFCIWIVWSIAAFQSPQRFPIQEEPQGGKIADINILSSTNQ
jgi:hypothetical protein